MPELPFTLADLETLRRWDTPTVCNALELLVPARRGRGFSVRPFLVANPGLPPICGLARTGTIRAAQPSGRSLELDRVARLTWYDYVAEAELPTIVVMEDLDETPGFGAFWGEVNGSIHRAIGVQGCVTNGALRDVDHLPSGLQILAGMTAPSHAHAHIVDFGREVAVHGMPCAHDDVVHADKHGSVVIPADVVRDLPEAISVVTRQEKAVLDLCRGPDFSLATLRQMMECGECGEP